MGVAEEVSFAGKPKFLAAIALLRRTAGCVGFQVRYSDDGEPTVWLAVSEYQAGERRAWEAADVGGQTIAQVTNWHHQHINRPGRARYAGPPGSVNGSRSDSVNGSVNPAVNGSVNDSRREGKGRERKSSSSTSDSRPATSAPAGDGAPAGRTRRSTEDPTIAAAFDLVAERRLADAQAAGQRIAKPRAWLATTRAERVAAAHDEAVRLLADAPDLTHLELAVALEGGGLPARHRVTPAPEVPPTLARDVQDKGVRTSRAALRGAKR